MELLEQIKAILPDLTPGERMAAQYILDYPYDVVRFPAIVIADNADTSRSNVVRFCKKLGFSGYAEFSFALDQSLKGMKQFPAPGEDAREKGPENVLQKYLSEFGKLETLYHSTQLKEIAAMITGARRIVVLGKDHSFFSAQQLTFRLCRAGLDAVATNMETMMSPYLGMLTEQDVVVVFSVQGRKESYGFLKDYQKARVVLVTVAARAPIAPYVDQVVALPSVTRSYSSDMLDEAPTFYLFIELLMEAIHTFPRPLSED